MSWLTTSAMSPMVSQSWSKFDNGNSSDVSSWYDPDCDYIWPNMVETVILCFIYSLIGLVGFVGNFLVVFTIFFKRGSKSVTSMLLCSLALSDIMVVTVFLPMKLADFLAESWILGSFACKLVGYLALFSPSCSACMLMVIGLERFIVILYPLKARWLVTRLRAKIIVVATWVISLVLGIPGLVFQSHVIADVPHEFLCIKEYFRLDSLKKGYPLYGLLILYIIPLLVMGFAYVNVCLRLYASTKTSRGLQSMKAPAASSGHVSSASYAAPAAPRPSTLNSCAPPPNPNNAVPSSVDDDPFSGGSEGRYETATSGRLLVPGPGGPAQTQPRRQKRPARRSVSLKDRQQVILMLILVVVLYAITWGPLLFISTSYAFGVLDMVCMHVINQLSAACHVLAFINSAINPIVYSFMSRNFRQTVVEAFTSCIRCLVPGRRGRRGDGLDSMYYNSRQSSTTLVVPASSVRRGRAPSDCNYSPSRGPAQIVEMTQYTRLPNSEPKV